MSPASASRRRMVAAATFVACLLVGAPAAYAAGSAVTDGDRAAENVIESGSAESGSDSESNASDTGSGSDSDGAGSGSDSEGAGSGGHDHSGSGGQGSGSDSGSDSGSGQDGGSGQDDGEPGGDDDAGRGDGPDQDTGGSALDILASDCTGSGLQPHNGFQEAPRCVSTEFGEVADAANSPSLLITEAPDAVEVGQGFQLQVSTRNLVRDRFLAAADGGYYAESSLLNGEGLQRGHFHTACRILPNPGEAPDSAPDPLFFEATEDGNGGSAPDTVTIDVPGVQEAGELQCSSWAGDGSHRTPMMQRANQTPAFDSVRVEVG